MSLVSAVEQLQKSPCTASQIETLNEFQKIHKIGNDDPLVIVLALMARSQLILESTPTLLKQKADETIELHRTMLRDQSVIIAKELVGTLTQIIHNEVRRVIPSNHNVRNMIYAGIGSLVSGLIIAIVILKYYKVVI